MDYEYDDEDTSMDNVVEGDIMVTPGDNDDGGLRAAMTTDQDRNGILGSFCVSIKVRYCRMWTGGRIPYTLHSSIRDIPSRKDLVETALREIEDVSCVKFVNISGLVKDYRTPPVGYPHFL